jgi:tRNA dimethylallyltransferase
MRRAAVLLMGPTGVGKSELALALAERLPLEIVSVDSALVYRGMDIGTAKPSAAVRAEVPHHLIDIREPTVAYSAGEFVRDAGLAMQAIWARGRQPLLVGGTMLYFHALTEGIADLPEADRSVRAEIEAQARAAGWKALHQELARVDPDAAQRIHGRDPQRIQRALEVFRLTGQTLTALQRISAKPLADVRRYEIVLQPADRQLLQRRLADRFRAMLAAGFLDEMRGLFSRSDLSGEHPSMRAVGYRQMWKYLQGGLSLTQAEEAAIVATRQLAKRQLTWLRRRRPDVSFDSMHPNVASLSFDALSESIFAEWS